MCRYMSQRVINFHIMAESSIHTIAKSKTSDSFNTSGPFFEFIISLNRITNHLGILVTTT